MAKNRDSGCVVRWEGDVRGEMDDATQIKRNVEAIEEQIREAAIRAGRDSGSICLVAATKFVPVERILSAIAAGVGIIGENRVQEALDKQGRLVNAPSARRSQNAPAWHFIGRLQRRKAKAVVGRFELVHSLDSLSLAQEMNRRAGEAGVTQRVLLELNLGGEPTKGGFAPEALFEALPQIDAFPHLDVCGLMTVPPWTEQPEQARPYFHQLRELADRIMQRRWERIHLAELSMGMSRDFEIAIEEGATLVRIGTAIFGPRPV